jgi:membrane protein implicated in regulation of membrane protease activity
VTHSDWYLFCFAFGLLWSIAALLLGGFHGHGHGHGAHVHHHGGLHAPKGVAKAHGTKLWSEFLNLHSISIFLAWAGGCGFLASRHSSWGVGVVLVVSLLAGLMAAAILSWFLRTLQKREQVLDPDDYDMVGVWGRIASAIRAGGTGEILFSRDGCRKAAPARSDMGEMLERGTEVVVTRYQNGIAYVRPWDEFAPTGEQARQWNRSGGEETPPVPGQ